MMKKYNIVFLASFIVTTMVAYATPIAQLSVTSAMKKGEQVQCIGTKKVFEGKKLESVKKGYKVELTLNESGYFEATEQETDDLGGYSPIPYPCKYIGGFTSKDLNITNEKVFVCRDDSYVVTEEIYLLKNCVIVGR